MRTSQNVRTAPAIRNDNVVLIKTPQWMDLGACVSLVADSHPDRDSMFPASKDEARHFARKYCAPCPVRDACYQWAVDRKVEYGVYGGALFGKDHLQETA